MKTVWKKIVPSEGRATVTVVVTDFGHTHADRIHTGAAFNEQAREVAKQFACQWQDSSGLTNGTHRLKCGATFHGKLAREAAGHLARIY